MKALKLPLTQSAGYIYDASGQLIGRFFDKTGLKHYEMVDLTDATITALNTLIPGIDHYLQLSDAIIDLQCAVHAMDKETRDRLDPIIERAHKAKKALFVNSKLISKIHKVKKL